MVALHSAVAHPHALRGFLQGEWTLSKTFDYVRGGVTSSFFGTATFTPLIENILSYEERGELIVQGQPNMPAYRRLLWDFSDNPVSVSFDEAQDRSSASEILAGARFFHHISLASTTRLADGNPPSFEHPCGPDLYIGQLLLSKEDEFEILWRVVGPRKNGSILNSFVRRRLRDESQWASSLSSFPKT